MILHVSKDEKAYMIGVSGTLFHFYQILNDRGAVVSLIADSNDINNLKLALPGFDFDSIIFIKMSNNGNTGSLYKAGYDMPLATFDGLGGMLTVVNGQHALFDTLGESDFFGLILNDMPPTLSADQSNEPDTVHATVNPGTTLSPLTPNVSDVIHLNYDDDSVILIDGSNNVIWDIKYLSIDLQAPSKNYQSQYPTTVYGMFTFTQDNFDRPDSLYYIDPITNLPLKIAQVSYENSLSSSSMTNITLRSAMDGHLMTTVELKDLANKISSQASIHIGDKSQVSDIKISNLIYLEKPDGTLTTADSVSYINPTDYRRIFFKVYESNSGVQQELLEVPWEKSLDHSVHYMPANGDFEHANWFIRTMEEGARAGQAQVLIRGNYKPGVSIAQWTLAPQESGINDTHFSTLIDNATFTDGSYSSVDSNFGVYNILRLLMDDEKHNRSEAFQAETTAVRMQPQPDDKYSGRIYFSLDREFIMDAENSYNRHPEKSIFFGFDPVTGEEVKLHDTLSGPLSPNPSLKLTLVGHGSPTLFGDRTASQLVAYIKDSLGDDTLKYIKTIVLEGCDTATPRNGVTYGQKVHEELVAVNPDYAVIKVRGYESAIYSGVDSDAHVYLEQADGTHVSRKGYIIGDNTENSYLPHNVLPKSISSSPQRTNQFINLDNLIISSAPLQEAVRLQAEVGSVIERAGLALISQAEEEHWIPSVLSDVYEDDQDHIVLALNDTEGNNHRVALNISEYSVDLRNNITSMMKEATSVKPFTLENTNQGINLLATLIGFKHFIEGVEDDALSREKLISGGVLNAWGIGDISGVNQMVMNKLGDLFRDKILNETTTALEAGFSGGLDAAIGSVATRLGSLSGLSGEAAQAFGSLVGRIPIVGTAIGGWTLYNDAQLIKMLDESGGTKQQKDAAIAGTVLDSVATIATIAAPFTGPAAPFVLGFAGLVSLTRIFVGSDGRFLGPFLDNLNKFYGDHSHDIEKNFISDLSNMNDSTTPMASQFFGMKDLGDDAQALTFFVNQDATSLTKESAFYGDQRVVIDNNNNVIDKFFLPPSPSGMAGFPMYFYGSGEGGSVSGVVESSENIILGVAREAVVSYKASRGTPFTASERTYWGDMWGDKYGMSNMHINWWNRFSIQGNDQNNNFISVWNQSYESFEYNVDGGGGDDSLILSAYGQYSFNGGEGSDWLAAGNIIQPEGARIVLDLRASGMVGQLTRTSHDLTIVQALPNLSIHLTDVENLLASDQDEVLIGNALANQIITGGGDDLVFTSDGGDTYTLNNGSGNTTFYNGRLTQSTTRDTVYLQGSTFKALNITQEENDIRLSFEDGKAHSVVLTDKDLLSQLEFVTDDQVSFHLFLNDQGQLLKQLDNAQLIGTHEAPAGNNLSWTFRTQGSTDSWYTTPSGGVAILDVSLLNNLSLSAFLYDARLQKTDGGWSLTGSHPGQQPERWSINFTDNTDFNRLILAGQGWTVQLSPQAGAQNQTLGSVTCLQASDTTASYTINENGYVTTMLLQPGKNAVGDDWINSGLIGNPSEPVRVILNEVDNIFDPSADSPVHQMNFIIDGGAGNDLLVGMKFDDKLYGDAGNDTLYGMAGDDLLYGGEGDDILDGGDGNDTAVFNGLVTATSPTDEGVNIKLHGAQKAQTSGGDAQGDMLSNIENIIGSPYDDVLTGDENDNILYGNAGNDILSGGGGNDLLSGGAGEDMYVITTGEKVVIDAKDNGDSIDTLMFGENEAESLHYSIQENSLLVTGDNGTQVLLNNWFKGDNHYRVLLSSDGLEMSDFQSEVQAGLKNTVTVNTVHHIDMYMDTPAPQNQPRVWQATSAVDSFDVSRIPALGMSQGAAYMLDFSDGDMLNFQTSESGTLTQWQDGNNLMATFMTSSHKSAMFTLAGYHGKLTESMSDMGTTIYTGHDSPPALPDAAPPFMSSPTVNNTYHSDTGTGVIDPLVFPGHIWTATDAEDSFTVELTRGGGALQGNEIRVNDFSAGTDHLLFRIKDYIGGDRGAVTVSHQGNDSLVTYHSGSDSLVVRLTGVQGTVGPKYDLQHMQ